MERHITLLTKLLTWYNDKKFLSIFKWETKSPEAKQYYINIYINDYLK